MIMNLAPIRLTIASMTANLGQILFPIGFVSHFLTTTGLRSPMHSAAIAHRHAACAAESTALCSLNGVGPQTQFVLWKSVIGCSTLWDCGPHCGFGPQ